MELSSSLATRLWRGPIPDWQLRARRALATMLRDSAANKRLTWLIAILIGVLHAALAVTAVNTKSATFDEPQHLTAGYSHFVTNDFRLDPENGDLPAMWAALPLLFDNLKFIPLNDRGWQRAEEGRTAHQFFYEVGNDPDEMLREARTMMSIFGAALCLLIYRCAREFFGVIGGLVAEIAAAFDPNLLAHSALVSSDVPAAFFFTATVWSWWRLFQKITPASVLIAGLSLSALFLTKFSAPVVLPVLGAVSILKIWSRGEMAIHFAPIQIEPTEKWKKASVIAASWFVLIAILFLAIWGSCSFRYAAWTDNRDSHPDTSWHWNYLLENGGLFPSSVNFARRHHLLPEPYLYGFAYVSKHEIDRPAFLDNHWSIVGFRSFFPRAVIYKTPVSFLLLLMLAVYGAMATRRSWKIENVFNPLWGFALIYGAFAITAQLNIGHRHILPIYPAMFVASAAVVRLFGKRHRTIFASAVAILLCWQVGEAFAIQPNYLAYFNQIAGGPSRGYQHLVDSSLDWGQDLPTLKNWIGNHQALVDGKRLYLGYFGTADPRWYGIEAKLLAPDKQLPNQQAFAPLTGGIYCVSATTLQSVYVPELGPWCTPYERRYRTLISEMQPYLGRPGSGGVVQVSSNAGLPSQEKIQEFVRLRFARLCAFLRHQEPITQIGYSIFVFDLSEDDIARAIYGRPAELEPEVRVTGY